MAHDTVLDLLARRWSNQVESFTRAPGTVCPRCGALAGEISLLTPWLVYLVCDECHHRWSAVQRG